MNEEEKKAIEFLKEIVLEFEKCNSEYVIDKVDKYGFLNSFKVVINLTEKQQKEIEEKNVAINKMSKDISRQLKEIQRLEKDNDTLSELVIVNEDKVIKELDLISKDKIRERIKEYRKETMLCQEFKDYENANINQQILLALQELLEEN